MTTGPDTPQTVPGSMKRGMPLGAYFTLLLVLFAVTAGAAAIYVYVQSDRDAIRAAQHDTTNAARIASTQLAQDVAALKTTSAQLAANPQIGVVFDNPQSCSLTFGLTDFGGGHIDILRPDGSRVCSSSTSGASDYGGEAWVRQAASGNVFLAPVIDRSSGKQVIISASPVPGGRGIVAAFADLEPLGGHLISLYGAGDPLEFLITSRDGRTAIARSIDPSRWVGAPLKNTSFAPGVGGQEWRDVDGTTRIYHEHPVAGAGWRFYAGEDMTKALAAASTLRNRELSIILGGLAVVVLATLLIYRRLALPLTRLGRAVASRKPDDGAESLPVSGPAEVADLARHMNGLMSSVDRELAERRLAEAAVQRSEHNYRLLFESSPSPMCVCDSETFAILEVNDAAVTHYGYERSELLELTVMDLFAPTERSTLTNVLSEETATERVGPLQQVAKDGSEIETRLSSHPVRFGDHEARFMLMEDVGERERFERQMRQSQRLESLGQLAGGVAHDFNNLLGVIMGYTQFARERITAAVASSPESEDWKSLGYDVDQIDEASQRAAALTHQLLAFARREVVQPTVLDVNSVVDELEPLLRRTLGERVQLSTSLSENLSKIEIDKGQLEQVLVNLAVNARDAMPEGGDLTIDTANVEVDDHFATNRPGLATGSYVWIRVSDTGAGMDERTLQRAFEPFFTTKPTGSGTGLGLATVYGIITQAGGRAQIYSEPGIGTTFTALLPVTAAHAGAERKDAQERPGGSETILVVEDEDALREVTERMLSRHGYSVLTAADGPQALDLVAHHQGDIDLLVSDVVMPKMLGREVADRVRELRPLVHVLYISGYARPVLGSQGTLEAEVALLEKPFSEPALLNKVREVLATDSG
jgi:PAS domain S-box-containing protein